MWCRVLLFVIALTCTFQREIIADTDDVLCLVILSGLQKEDFDVNLLEKLQRHNVNIDDINNRKNIEKCMLASWSSNSSKENGSAKEIVPVKSEQPEKIFTQVNYNINETVQVEEISKENENKTDFNTSRRDNSTYVESRTIPSYENFINLWNTLNKTSHLDNEFKPIKETRKGLNQLPLSFVKDTKIGSQAAGLDLIHEMLESYIFTTKADITTIKPTIVSYELQNQINIVSEQIMKILNNNNFRNDITLAGRRSEEPQPITSKHKVNTNVNETVQEITKNNENKIHFNTSEIENGTSRNILQNPNFENIINLWIKLNKTNYKDNRDKTTKETEENKITRLSNTIAKETNIDSQVTVLDFIHNILSRYLSQITVTTIKTTTTEKQIDTVSQQIKKFLKNNNINHDTTLLEPPEETNKIINVDTGNLHDGQSLMRKNDVISNKLLTQKYKLNIPAPLEPNFEALNPLENNLRIIKTKSNLSKQMPITLNKDTNADPQLKYIEMFKAFIAGKYGQTSTQQPTTTPKHIDITLQDIKDILENKDINNQVTANDMLIFLGNRDLNAYKTYYINNLPQDLLPRKSISIQNINKLRNQDKSTITTPYKTNPIDKQFNKSQIVKGKTDIQLEKKPTTFKSETKADSHSKELDQIFHMFENYIATKDAQRTLSVPTTTSQHIDDIAQKVKEYLDSNNNKYRRVIERQGPAQNQSAEVPKVFNTDNKLLVTRKIDYMKELQRQANQLKIADSLEISTKKQQKSNKISRTVQNKVLKVNKVIDTLKNPLTEDVIREITEKVKASVLKDLQKEISSTLRSVIKETTTKMTTNTKNVNSIYNATTGLNNFKKIVQRFKKESSKELPSVSTTLQIDQNKIKTATNALENFIELFQQFKNIKDSMTIPNDQTHTFIRKGKTKNEFHGPINVVYPTLLPLNYAYNNNNTRAVSDMPIFINPYGFHINNPMVQKNKKFQYFVDPQNNMESKMEHALQAAVIQTDDVQVPLLGIPVPNSVSPINQNIIVTTKHPMIQFIDQEQRSNAKIKKRKYQDYTARNRGNYDNDSDRQSDLDLGRDMERHFNNDMTRYHSDMERSYRNLRGRYSNPDYKKRLDQLRFVIPRGKQPNSAIDNFYQEYLSNIKATSDKHWDPQEFSQEHKRERFHEKLERPDENQYRFRDHETPKYDERLKVASRQQLSINDLKKNKRNDDAHYIKFLKSQKKVNDMLEKILKSTNKDRSVEAI